MHTSRYLLAVAALAGFPACLVSAPLGHLPPPPPDVPLGDERMVFESRDGGLRFDCSASSDTSLPSGSPDPNNCGGCGIVCGAGSACVAGVCLSPSGHPRTLSEITALSATGCVSITHAAVTGNDHGGLVVGGTGVYYTGDRATGVFAMDTLTTEDTLAPMAALVSDLHSGTVYTLANGTQALADGGGTVTALVAVSGRMTGTVVPLSRALLVGPGTGLFSGWDLVVLHTGTAAYGIVPATGLVTNLGAVHPTVHQSCGAWAYWGVAEHFADGVALDYVRDSTHIDRLRLSTDVTETLGSFTDLGDLCGIGISPGTQSWYWHTHTASQFGPAGETLGFCPATWVQPPAPEAYTQEDVLTADADWVDACNAPGHESVLARVDDGDVQRPLPFAFRYWDVSRPAGSLVNIVSNGWLGMDGRPFSTLGGQIPTSGIQPGSVVAVHWGDLVGRTDGVCVATVGTAPSRRWVAEWSDAYYCCGDNRNQHLTFEAVLEESTGTIELIYQSMVNSRVMTVGIENQDDSDWEAVCNAGGMCSVTTGTAIRFHR